MQEISMVSKLTLGLKHPVLFTYSLMQVMMNGAQGDQNAKMTFDGVDRDGDLLLTFEEMRAVHENMNVTEEQSRRGIRSDYCI